MVTKGQSCCLVTWKSDPLKIEKMKIATNYQMFGSYIGKIIDTYVDDNGDERYELDVDGKIYYVLCAVCHPPNTSELVKWHLMK